MPFQTGREKYHLPMQAVSQPPAEIRSERTAKNQQRVAQIHYPYRHGIGTPGVSAAVRGLPLPIRHEVLEAIQITRIPRLLERPCQIEGIIEIVKIEAPKVAAGRVTPGDSRKIERDVEEGKAARADGVRMGDALGDIP